MPADHLNTINGLTISLEISLKQLREDLSDFEKPQMDTINMLIADLHWLEDIVNECKKIREIE